MTAAITSPRMRHDRPKTGLRRRTERTESAAAVTSAVIAMGVYRSLSDRPSRPPFNSCSPNRQARQQAHQPARARTEQGLGEIAAGGALAGLAQGRIGRHEA